MRPPSMNTTRSLTSRAKAISWVTTIIVMPSSASCRTTLSTSPTSSGSSAEVISSKQQHLGVHRDGTRYADALLLAAGELRGVAVDLVGKADAGKPAFSDISRASAFERPRTLRSPSMTFSAAVRCGNK